MCSDGQLIAGGMYQLMSVTSVVEEFEAITFTACVSTYSSLSMLDRSTVRNATDL